MASNPWGSFIGPLALYQCNDLPNGSRKHFPKNFGKDSQDPKEHILAMTTVSGILGIQEEDFFVRLFFTT